MSNDALGASLNAALPYFQEYLASVLRPKIERILEQESDTWNQVIWQTLVQAVLEQQPAGSATPESVERLLRDALGLKVDALVQVRFDPPAGAAGATPAHESSAPAAAPSQAATGSVIDRDQVVTTRRPADRLPLVRAVTGIRRADA